MELKTYLSGKRGRTSRLARVMNVAPATVSQWSSKVRRVPVLRCLEIEAILHGAVTRQDLRPDIDWERLS